MSESKENQKVMLESNDGARLEIGKFAHQVFPASGLALVST
jgi:hypothetical protein